MWRIRYPRAARILHISRILRVNLPPGRRAVPLVLVVPAWPVPAGERPCPVTGQGLVPVPGTAGA